MALKTKTCPTCGHRIATKLTPDAVRAIRAAYPAETQRTLAKRYGVTTSCIHYVVARRTHKDVN